MTIKILEKTPGCMPIIRENGDWIDLYTAEEIKLKAPQANKMHIRKGKSGELRTRDVDFDWTLIPLGVAMEMPKGTECHLLPRSSAFKDWGLLQTNSMGIIDRSYASDKDEWKLSVVATREVTIPKGTRLCQFSLVPSQKATFMQKLKWFISRKVKLIKVASLDNPERGGFGSTGK